jgi:PhnB protein
MGFHIKNGDMIETTIAPWFTVRDGERAVAFYSAAFGAVVVYRLEPVEAGFVVRLAVGGAEFWVSEEAEDGGAVGGGTVRMILTVGDPDEVFVRAVAAGATVVFPVGEGHGWRLGRLIDPFGLHWEIGHPLG